jgi:hypothetical protein
MPSMQAAVSQSLALLIVKVLTLLSLRARNLVMQIVAALGPTVSLPPNDSLTPWIIGAWRRVLAVD